MATTITTITAQPPPDIYLFGALNKAELGEIMQTMRVVELRERDRLFTRGQPATQFFVVRRGQIKLSRVSPDGHEKIIEIIGPGGTFAEAVMFMDAKEYPVNAEALSPTEVLSFNNAAFLNILRQSTDTCFKLMAEISVRLHRRLAEIDGLTLHDATFRLVTYFLSQRPEGAQDRPMIHLSVPKSVLASRLSIQPETFSRILAKLCKQEIIEVQGNKIWLLDIPALQEMASVTGH